MKNCKGENEGIVEPARAGARRKWKGRREGGQGSFLEEIRFLMETFPRARSLLSIRILPSFRSSSSSSSDVLSRGERETRLPGESIDRAIFTGGKSKKRRRFSCRWGSFCWKRLHNLYREFFAFGVVTFLSCCGWGVL